MDLRPTLRSFLHGACGIAATLAAVPALAEGDAPQDIARDRAQWIAGVAAAEALGPGAEAESARLAKLSGPELADALRALGARADLPTHTRERLLHESLLRIGQGPLQDAAELDLLRAFLEYKSEVTYLEPACRTHVEQPVFPIAEAARQALDRRVQLDGRLEGERLFAAGDLRALIGQLSEERGPFAQGMIDAVYTGERIPAIEAAILAMNPVLVSHEPVAALLEGCCAVSRDPRTEERIIRHAPERYALRVLGWVHTHGEEAAMPLFEAGVARAETASAAVLAMGHFAAREGPARERLVGLLPDPELGGSAALALSRAHDPELIERLGSMLMAETSRAAQARLVLALRLARTPRGADFLARFAARPDVDAQLRAEVAGR